MEIVNNTIVSILEPCSGIVWFLPAVWRLHPLQAHISSTTPCMIRTKLQHIGQSSTAQLKAAICLTLYSYLSAPDFPTGSILEVQFDIELNLANMSSRTYKRQSCLAVDQVVAGLERAYSHLRCNGKQENSKTKNRRPPIPPYQRQLLAQRILDGASLLGSIVDIKKSMEKPHFSEQLLLASGTSVTENTPFSTIK